MLRYAVIDESWWVAELFDTLAEAERYKAQVSSEAGDTNAFNRWHIYQLMENEPC